jgi:hypothetical protein
VENMLNFCVVGEQQMIVFLLFFERAGLKGKLQFSIKFSASNLGNRFCENGREMFFI